MSDEILLSFLCNWLNDYRVRVKRKLTSLKKDLDAEPDNKKIRVQATEKERELAMITKNKIQDYQVNWVALSEHSRRPCPLCFIHGKTSYLIALPEINNEEPFKCESCKEKFYIPMEE